MSNFDLISKLFHEHIEYLSLSADTIVDASENIASQIANAIVSERKVFSVGIGIDAAPASTFYHLVRDGLGADRPTLPIIRMTAEHADPIDSASQWLAKEIKSLGQPGDVAVVWGSQMSGTATQTILAAVEQRGVQSCWVGAQGPGASLNFSQTNTALRFSLSNISALAIARLVEVHLFGT